MLDKLAALRAIGESQPETWPPRRLSLALQGGGSFGAFTWGALDRLLEDESISFETLSGASAGAVNGALLACGHAQGGREGARARLAAFWKRVSAPASFLPTSALTANLLAHLAPHQLNPFDLNPLRHALAAEIDFDLLRAQSDIQLLIVATRVRDGQARYFTNAELSVDVLLASTCLPQIHRTVEIDGEPYWDGGYVANPPLIELVERSRAPHVLIVQITPDKSDAAPTSVRDIERRLAQITFNATLNTEVDMLRRACDIARRSWLPTTPETRRLRALSLSRIVAQDSYAGLEDADAANLDWRFLTGLRDAGRAAAEEWLREGTPVF
jgi:NTE family protein